MRLEFTGQVKSSPVVITRLLLHILRIRDWRIVIWMYTGIVKEENK